MRLAAQNLPHLCYSTGIHPGESWSELRATLVHHVTAVKKLVSPMAPMGVGLRLSAMAAYELSRGGELERARQLLSDEGLYVFTVSARAYGGGVKEELQRPDWLHEERLAYTDRVAHVLAALLPEPSISDGTALSGSINTLAGAERRAVRTERDELAIADRIVRHASTLFRLRERTGKSIALALEPEPGSFLSSTDDVIAFFGRALHSADAAAHLARLTGMASPAAAAFLREHVGVCLDTCNLAVEREDPVAAMSELRAAGVRVVKVQLASALDVEFADWEHGAITALSKLADGHYLHAVNERLGDREVLHRDLPAALGARRIGTRAPRRWRVCYPAPVTAARLGRFATTQDELIDLLAELRGAADGADTPHLEIDTYTWGVMPAELRTGPVEESIAAELEWVKARLEAGMW